MQYREMKDGIKVSILGFGCMRFQKKGNKIDMLEAEKELLRAIELGVNYYDTAYIYGGSEATLGEIFEKNNCRADIYIATKLPHYMVRNKRDLDKYLNEQLERLRTDYIDYYLIHMLTDISAWNKLLDFDIEEWVAEKKLKGIIKNIGFSFHGCTETFIELINVYDWDFCQIQYNYIDEHTQAGKRGLKYAAAKKIPVIIMEPLRGGRLVNLLPESAKKIMKNYNSKRGPAEWAFRWLYNQSEVTCVLSGMNTLEMLEENVRVATEVQAGEFSEEDFSVIEKVKAEISKGVKVGCTGCGYCMPCPFGVDIPNTFSCYNKMYLEDKSHARWEYQQITGLKKENTDASKCTNCGACELKCPQHIEIRKELKSATSNLQPMHIKIMKTIVNIIMKNK